MRSIDALVPPVENDNSNKLYEKKKDKKLSKNILSATRQVVFQVLTNTCFTTERL